MVQHVHISISGFLNKNEWEVIENFCEKCKRLLTTKLAREGGGDLRAQITFNVQNGSYSEFNLPPEEQIVEFLTAFRFFYLQNEQTHFPKILNIIGKYATHSKVKTALKGLRKGWGDSLFKNTMNIRYNDTPVTSSLLFNLWFNGYYFHSDPDKIRELQNMMEVMSESFLKYMLLDAAYEATDVVFKLYNGGFQKMLTEHNSSC